MIPWTSSELSLVATERRLKKARDRHELTVLLRVFSVEDDEDEIAGRAALLVLLDDLTEEIGDVLLRPTELDNIRPLGPPQAHRFGLSRNRLAKLPEKEIYGVLQG